MDSFIALLMPIEMLFINLFVIDKCSKKKFSSLFTYLVLIASGVIIVGVASLLLADFLNIGNGNGMFVFIGFLYMIPLKLIYKTTIAKIVSLACTSWVYTFFIFSVSVHMSTLLADVDRGASALVIQTLLYAITLFWFLKILKYRFTAMLSQLTKKETLELMVVSIVWFWTAFILNFTLVYSNIPLLKVLSMLSVAFCALSTYVYIYNVINNNRIIQELEHIAYHDELTQLRGRALLSNDIEKLIDKKIDFHVVFMDLDNFKSINDTYGHNVGDDYLAFFAQQVKYRLGSRGGFYRIAGDEFVCLYTDGSVSTLINSLDSIPEKLPDSGIPFIGVSYGVAHYPEHGKNMDELIEFADNAMYDMKRKVHEKIAP